MTDPNIAIIKALGLGDLKLLTRVEVVLRAGKEPYVSFTRLHPQTGEPYEVRGTLYAASDGTLRFYRR